MTTNRDFGSLARMKEADPSAFGRRARERREQLGISQGQVGKLSGYSQTNIGWIEQGRAKRPRLQAEAIAGALRTTAEWLLWGTGQRETGPPIMTSEEIRASYDLLPLDDRAILTQAMTDMLETLAKNRMSR
jgi:transcriptional regulator with XRE-family HTH domain